jgi:hypothetical protein
MNRTHTAVIALALAVAAVLGATAAMRTVGLNRSASARPAAPSAAIAERTHRLDRIEAALRRSLHSRPPKLPRVPALHRPAPVQVAAPVTAAPPRVVYQRPAPIVIVTHRSHGEGDEGEDGGGDD